MQPPHLSACTNYLWLVAEMIRFGKKNSSIISSLMDLRVKDFLSEGNQSLVGNVQIIKFDCNVHVCMERGGGDPHSCLIHGGSGM